MAQASYNNNEKPDQCNGNNAVHSPDEGFSPDDFIPKGLSADGLSPDGLITK